MEVSHLLVNGCSFTYGQGLDDPINRSWPALVAKKLGIPLVNLSFPGSSNQGIRRRTYEYLFSSTCVGSPLAITALTMYSRLEAWYNRRADLANHYATIEYHGRKIKKDPYTESYMLNYNEENFVRQTMIDTLALKSLFESKNIPYLIADYSGDEAMFLKLQAKGYIETLKKKCYDQHHIGSLCELTSKLKKLPCGHDGDQAQEVVAKYVLGKIDDIYGDITPVSTEFDRVSDMEIPLPFKSIWATD